jgi:hypothetical protein
MVLYLIKCNGKYNKFCFLLFLNIQLPNHFAGLPTANDLGMSLVTTDPPAQPLPMVIPGHITVLPPIQQSSPIIGKALSSVLRKSASSGCVAVYN